MECKQASELFMKYMDCALTKEEAASLKKHLDSCPDCKEDFLLYDSILEDFATMETVSPPEGFEACVMEKIAGLPAYERTPSNTIENMLYAVGGVFSTLLGLGFLLAMNKDAAMAYLSGTAFFARYISMLSFVSDYVEAFAVNFTSVVYSSVDQLSLFIGTFRYILLAVFVVIGVVQFYLYRKKVRAQ